MCFQQVRKRPPLVSRGDQLDCRPELRLCEGIEQLLCSWHNSVSAGLSRTEGAATNTWAALSELKPTAVANPASSVRAAVLTRLDFLASGTCIWGAVMWAAALLVEGRLRRPRLDDSGNARGGTQPSKISIAAAAKGAAVVNIGPGTDASDDMS